MGNLELPNDGPEYGRLLSALSIVRYIMDTTAIRQQAQLYDLPLGKVLGRPVSVLRLQTEMLDNEINSAIQAIGGIPATIEHGTSSSHVRLTQWRGADIEQTDMHNWLATQGTPGAIGQVSVDIIGLHDDLQASIHRD